MNAVVFKEKMPYFFFFFLFLTCSCTDDQLLQETRKVAEPVAESFGNWFLFFMLKMLCLGIILFGGLFLLQKANKELATAVKIGLATLVILGWANMLILGEEGNTNPAILLELIISIAVILGYYYLNPKKVEDKKGE